MIDKNNFVEDSNDISDSYIHWLEEFTELYPTFDSESFMFSSDKITDFDSININKLECLFEKIYEYAENNYIPYQRTDNSIFYCIVNNEIGYEIGIDYNPGCIFYCKRLEEFPENSVKFQDIINSSKIPITLFWDNELEKLINIIEELDDEDIPVEFIEKTATKAIQKIKRKKKE